MAVNLATCCVDKFVSYSSCSFTNEMAQSASQTGGKMFLLYSRLNLARVLDRHQGAQRLAMGVDVAGLPSPEWEK